MSADFLLVSPHLDDAVLSCGSWLVAHPGCIVLTVFAGTPADGSRCTDWDARSGFDSAAAAVAGRRREDEQALVPLGARPRWLDFCDGQYGESAAAATIGAALHEVLRELRPATLLLPLGLFHADHRRAHEAAAIALRELGDERPAEVLAYEDVPYRSFPGVLQRRLAELASDGVQATPHDDGQAAAADIAAAAACKAQALLAYPSQLRAFGGADGLPDAMRPERLWRLAGKIGAATQRRPDGRLARRETPG